MHREPQDTLSQLRIIYAIPDSNDILAVNFHIALTPSWQKNFRIDWNFGDSTGIISKFDTSILPHYYLKFGTYQVNLSVIDTSNKTLLGKTSVIVDLEDNPIDTNFLRGFTRIDISFSVATENQDFSTGNMSSSNFSISYKGNNPPFTPTILWRKNNIQIYGSHSDSHAEYDQYGHQIAQMSSGESFSLGCVISHAGYKIDSGWYKNSSDEYDITQHTWVFGNSVKSINYQSLDRIFISADSIVFSNSGNELQSKVIQVQDSSDAIMTTTLPPPSHGSGYLLKNILWGQPPTPILRVTLYK